jgi:hypothetical protein
VIPLKIAFGSAFDKLDSHSVVLHHECRCLFFIAVVKLFPVGPVRRIIVENAVRICRVDFCGQKPLSIFAVRSKTSAVVVAVGHTFNARGGFFGIHGVTTPPLSTPCLIYRRVRFDPVFIVAVVVRANIPISARFAARYFQAAIVALEALKIPLAVVVSLAVSVAFVALISRRASIRAFAFERDVSVPHNLHGAEFAVFEVVLFPTALEANTGLATVYALA